MGDGGQKEGEGGPRREIVGSEVVKALGGWPSRPTGSVKARDEVPASETTPVEVRGEAPDDGASGVKAEH